MSYSKALQYAVNGYSIIPLKQNKKPLISAWSEFQKKPATDKMIEEWWEKNPNANIGIITGKISGVTVVDIDVKEGKSVPLDTFPKTFTVETPSGGYHLYYKYNGSIKQSANAYAKYPHVDIRNDGGYVVGPFSKVDGKEYKIIRDMELQKFPQSLFTKSEGTGRKVREDKGVSKKITDVKVMKDGDGRNNAMCSLLGAMLKGVPIGEYPNVKTSFFSIATAMENPLPKSELTTIWESIGQRAMEKATEIDLMVNSKGVAYVNLENVKKILTNDPNFAGRCIYDTFLQVYKYRGPKETVYRDLHDSDEITLTREISIKYGPQGFAMINPTMVRLALFETARENAIDSAEDWLRSIEWDGEKRLDTWLSKVYHVEDNEYHQTVGSNWLKGMANRIISPACKFDYVLVLEGEQGTRKSTSLGILGGEWHVETTVASDSKDFLMLLQGNLIIEFSEGETLSRGEIKQLKAVITTQFDKYRAPYERNIQTHPRRCVFAMTTNQTEYLKDETGNRRWLPVATKGIADTEWLKENRDQLLAEALYRVETLKETTYDFSDTVREEQAKRQVTDPNMDRVVEWYDTALTDLHREQGVTPHMAYVGALGQLNGKFNKKDEMDIANIFSNNLDLVKVQLEGRVRSQRWFQKDCVLPEGAQVMTINELQEIW